MLNLIKYNFNPILRKSSNKVPKKWIVNRCAISKEKKYCFIRIPKCANSTVTRTLAHYDSNINYDINMDLDGYYAKKLFDDFFSLDKLSLDNFVNEYYIFTFVRHPFSRILSAYLDKIYPEKDSFIEHRKRVIKYSKNGKLSFSSFVDYLENEGLYSNPHWCPQTDLMITKPSDMSFVGKVESLDTDMSKVLEVLFGVDNSRKIMTRSTSRVRASSLINNYYDESLKGRIMSLYKLDFDLLGYDKFNAI
jgi:dermatan 4-sulfotransferase 1